MSSAPQITSSTPHIPVMLAEVLETLAPMDGEVYVDGTFGNGGYSSAILDAADCSVIAIDRDSSAFDRAAALKEKYGERLRFLHGCFGDVENLLEGERVNGFVLDLGVSSMQLDQAERGFSFRMDGPLDMRMDQRADIPTAADLVNGMDERELADLIYQYGEERHSRRVARTIAEKRKTKRFETTVELADIVRKVVPKSKDGIDPATRTFQALRIAVNREMEELEKALKASEEILADGGRLVVVSFHSLEDKIVKRFLLERSGKASKGSRYMPVATEDDEPSSFDLPFKKALPPGREECTANPRARSAKLRMAVRRRR